MIIKNISKVLAGKEILVDVSFDLNKGDKIGVIGINGCGKSTLLKIICGLIDSTGGIIENDDSIAYLKQEIPSYGFEMSIIDFLYKDTNVGDIKDKLDIMQNNLNESNLTEYCELCEHFAEIDGYNFENNVKKLMAKLSINKTIYDKINTLSGGEKIKILLISVLLSDANILLLDEPTNNLDIESVNFLSDFLQNTHKSLLIISHDRKFLSAVTNKTLEIKDGKSTLYKYNYDTYIDVKNNEYEKQYSDYLDAKDKIKEIKNKISSEKRKIAVSQYHNNNASDNNKLGNNYNAEKGQNKSGKLLTKLQTTLDEYNTSVAGFKKKEQFVFKVDTQNLGFVKDIYLKDLICGYENFNTKSLNAVLPFASRVLIKGKNGSGKSTLIKTLLGKIKPVSGNIFVDQNIKFGYIEQETIFNANKDMLLVDYLSNDLPEVDKSKIFTVLHNFQIEYDQKDKKFLDFSAGERTKINLAKLSLQNINALILDEPTNHLDIESTEILLDAVKTFTGTIFAISHNLTFIEAFNPTVIIDMDNGSVSYK